MRRFRPLAISALALVALSAAPPAPVPVSQAEAGRVVVLGFDGADARTVRELMAAEPGRYPTFERLAASGTFAPLSVVAPPESPVSWAAINTGQNPAKTGVPGFVKRVIDEASGLPMPTVGHIVMEPGVPIERFENTPLPTWSKTTLGAAAGIGVFVVVTVLFMLLLRGRFAPAAIIGLVCGVGAGLGAGWARGFLPSEVPRTGNPNQARNFWDYAADAGVESLVLDAAQAFDMPAPDGAKVLAGLGVPDARGALGEWAIYTTNELEFGRAPRGRSSSTAGTIYRVDERDGVIRSKVYGPPNHWLAAKRAELKERLKDLDLSADEGLELTTAVRDLDEQLSEPLSVELVVTREGDAARVRLGDEEQVLREGEWSEFYHLTFDMNWLVKVHAITRVKLVHLEAPHFELFLNVLDIDPANRPAATTRRTAGRRRRCRARTAR
jgi:hypothetical protein